MFCVGDALARPALIAISNAHKRRHEKTQKGEKIPVNGIDNGDCIWYNGNTGFGCFYKPKLQTPGVRQHLNEFGYEYIVVIPPYLSFYGHIQVFKQTDEYILSLKLKPNAEQFSLRIADLTTIDETENIVYHFESPVDKNGHSLERQSWQSEAEYQEWLALYEKFNEPIMSMFAATKDVFSNALQ